MHELAICQSLLAKVEEISGAHHAAPVRRIVVQIGPLSGVDPGLLRDAFTIARAGSCADIAELAVETVPVRVHCTVCGNQSTARANRLLCASCGSFRTRVVSGDELLLRRVEFPPWSVDPDESDDGSQSLPETGNV